MITLLFFQAFLPADVADVITSGTLHLALTCELQQPPERSTDGYEYSCVRNAGFYEEDVYVYGRGSAGEPQRDFCICSGHPRSDSRCR